jgi:UDP-N-acetylmuramoylalanine--D-glutamate ligase
MFPVTMFARKSVAVFGLGASGCAAAHALAAGGAKVVAWDDNPESRAAAERAGLLLVDLEPADWRGFSALVLAPGVPLTHPAPHWTVEKAKAARVPVIGDVELFCLERKRVCPNAPFVAVTGTNGKSTTTALIAHLLAADGRDVQVGGNIGTPILSLAAPANNRIHVIELSSFQLDLTPSLRPSVGVLLNITPDHLDRHGNLEVYAAIKQRVVAAADQACIGVDDDFCRAIAEQRQRRKFTYLFSTADDFAGGYHLADETKLRFDDRAKGTHEELADIAGIGSLRGAHNAQNALAAIAALGALRSAIAALSLTRFTRLDPALSRGWYESQSDFASRTAWRGLYRPDPSVAHARRQALQAALASFPGLPHRLEQVGRRGRVLFINDSKATNADSTEKALASFTGDIYWIIGGKPKEGGIRGLEHFFPRITKAYLIGQATDEFAATLDGRVNFERCATLDRAVAAAAHDAAASTGPEPVVLLSPACASYDQFRNFEVRGDAFRQLVAALPGIEVKAPVGPSR